MNVYEHGMNDGCIMELASDRASVIIKASVVLQARRGQDLELRGVYTASKFKQVLCYDAWFSLSH